MYEQVVLGVQNPRETQINRFKIKIITCDFIDWFVLVVSWELKI